MLKYLLFIGVCLILSKVHSQSVIWTGQYGGSVITMNDMQVDQNENIFYAGDCKPVTDFDLTSNIDTFQAATFIYNGFVAKANSQGGYEWAKRFVTEAESRVLSITPDHSGNIIVAGMFLDSADFDPGPGTYTLHAYGNFYNNYVCKLDANGNFIWAKVFLPLHPLNDAYMFSVEVDAHDNIYFAGYISGDVDFDPDTSSFISSGKAKDAFICSLTGDGKFRWINRWGGNLEDKVFDIAFDNYGYLYAVGDISHDTIDFDPGPSSNTIICTDDIGFISKMDTSGNYFWTRFLESPGRSNCNRIECDGNSSIYISGYAYDSTDFDPGPGVLYMQSNNRNMLYALRLDLNGSLSWVKPFYVSHINSCYQTGLYLDPSGNLFVTGSFKDSIDLNQGASQYIFVDIILPTTGFLVAFSETGNFLNAFGLSTTGDAHSPLVRGGPTGMLLGGQFEGIVDFDLDSATVTMDYTNGQEYIVKYGQLPLAINNNYLNENFFKIFPNPVSSKSNINFSTNTSGILSITLIDQYGNIAKEGIIK